MPEWYIPPICHAHTHTQYTVLCTCCTMVSHAQGFHMPEWSTSPICHIHRVGENRMYTSYMTVYLFGDFPTKNTVCAPYRYGSGQPYIYISHKHKHKHFDAPPRTTCSHYPIKYPLLGSLIIHANVIIFLQLTMRIPANTHSTPFNMLTPFTMLTPYIIYYAYQRA